MATYGLTPQGWLSKPLSQISTELDTGLKKILGDSAGTNPDGSIPEAGMAGQLKTLMLDGFSSGWDQLQALAASLDPSAANDSAQDTVCSISGVQRHPAEFSTATPTCTGTPGTILQVARVLTTTDASASRFDSQPALLTSDPNYPSSTIAAANAWAPGTVYATGARVTHAGNIYLCTIGGTSAGSGGPVGTTIGAPIVDNTATWVFLGAGTGFVDVEFVAEAAGPIGALAYKLSTIATPVSGWLGAANAVAAVPGAVQETNAALRVRRDLEVSLDGNTTVDAIKAKLIAVNQNSTDPNHQAPTSVNVLFNDTDFTDANGLPPHSVECIVQGGTSADIAAAIWQAVGAGTNTYGVNQISTVIDSQGNPQTVRWTRPIQVPVYVVATLFYDPSKWPTDGTAPALVNSAGLSALLTFGLKYTPGLSVRSLRLGAAIIEEPSATDSSGQPIAPAPATSAAAPGLLDVAPLNIGIAPAPASSAPIAIGVRSIAVFDAARVTFTCTPEAP